MAGHPQEHLPPKFESPRPVKLVLAKTSAQCSGLSTGYPRWCACQSADAVSTSPALPTSLRSLSFFPRHLSILVNVCAGGVPGLSAGSHPGRLLGHRHRVCVAALEGSHAARASECQPGRLPGPPLLPFQSADKKDSNSACCGVHEG